MREEFLSRSYSATSPAVPAFHLPAALREVWQMLKRGIEFAPETEPKLHTELRELAKPHMAVLVHQRAKVTADPNMLQDERWFGELSDFVSRMLWPHIETSEALQGRSKNCIAELLDEIVAMEQGSVAMRELALADVLPRTSRFESSWAS